LLLMLFRSRHIIVVAISQSESELSFTNIEEFPHIQSFFGIGLLTPLLLSSCCAIFDQSLFGQLKSGVILLY
jgi:hypothetical protein